MDNVKVKYWSGLPVNYYNMDEVQPGDYVCLHNVQINVNQELSRLSQRFVIIPENRFVAQTIPLLPDIMATCRLPAGPKRYIINIFRRIL